MKNSTLIVLVSFFCMLAVMAHGQLNDSPANVSVLIDTSAFTKYIKVEPMGEGEYGEPLTRLYFMVDGKTFLIAEQVVGYCYDGFGLEGDPYEIPDEALVAFWTWWAGSGELFCIVIPEPGTYRVLHKMLEEPSDGEEVEKGPYSVLKDFVIP